MPSFAPFPSTWHLRPRNLLISLLLATLCLGTVNAQNAQFEPADLRRALGRTYEKGNYLTAVSQRNWRIGVNMVAAMLTTGESIPLTVPFAAEDRISILASAETEVCILDLQLYSPTGQLLTADTAMDATPVLTYTIPTTGTYQIRLYLRAANQPTLGVAIALLQRKGTVLNARDYRALSGTFFTGSAAITAEGTGLAWAPPGEWAIYGIHLPIEGVTDIGGLRAQPAGSYFALTGPAARDDLQLLLSDADGRIVSDSGAASAFPVLRHASEQTGPYLLRILGGKRRPPGQFLLGLFTL